MRTLLDKTKLEIGFDMPLVEKILLTEFENTYVPAQEKAVVQEVDSISEISDDEEDVPVTRILVKKKHVEQVVSVPEVDDSSLIDASDDESIAENA